MKVNTLFCIFLLAVTVYTVPTEMEISLDEIFGELKDTETGDLVYSFF